jgi:hypothetical protein
MICAPIGSPFGALPIGATSAGRPGRDACVIQKGWFVYGCSPSGVVIVRASKGLWSWANAGVKFAGQRKRSKFSK